MIKFTDFAYAAGYIDGDGCFFIGKIFSENRIRFRCMIVINSVNIEILQWFQRIFGGSVTTYKKSIPKQKPLHRYVIKGKDLENFKEIGKYLIEKNLEFNLFEKARNSILKKDKMALIPQMHDLKKHMYLIHESLKQEIEPFKNTVIPTEEDFAYLAGFIDAECCLNISKYQPKNKSHPTYKILLQCGNTKSPCFKWLSERFGGQLYFVDRSKYDTPHRNQMQWRLSSASLLNILPKIHPFLKHKKPVCEELINFSKTMVSLNGTISRNSTAFAEFYKPILEERERIFHKIQALNKKGV